MNAAPALVDRDADRTRKAIAHLYRFLHGEQSAVVSYREVSRHVGSESEADRRICLDSHQQQAALLANRIGVLGGAPLPVAGPWPAIRQAVASSNTQEGIRRAHAALRSGEDRGLAGYLSRMPDLDDDSRLLVERDVRPAQFRTHEAIRRMCARGARLVMQGGA